MGFGAFLGQGGKNLENPPKKISTHGEGLRRSWTGDMTCFFLLFHGFGAVLSYFRIWIVCMKVWDRCETCAFLQCARLHAPSSSLLYIYIYYNIAPVSWCCWEDGVIQGTPLWQERPWLDAGRKMHENSRRCSKTYFTAPMYYHDSNTAIWRQNLMVVLGGHILASAQDISMKFWPLQTWSNAARWALKEKGPRLG